MVPRLEGWGRWIFQPNNHEKWWKTQHPIGFHWLTQHLWLMNTCTTENMLEQTTNIQHIHRSFAIMRHPFYFLGESCISSWPFIGHEPTLSSLPQPDSQRSLPARSGLMSPSLPDGSMAELLWEAKLEIEIPSESFKGREKGYRGRNKDNWAGLAMATWGFSIELGTHAYEACKIQWTWYKEATGFVGNLISRHGGNGSFW